jgi:maltooligosyltrehalose synthase
MVPWIIDTDIKIIQLIRDPRAMINSMSKIPQTWKGTLDHINGMCGRMMNDTLLQSMLPPDRYQMNGQKIFFKHRRIESL